MESVGGTFPAKPAVYLQDLSVAASTAAAAAKAAVLALDENAPGTILPDAAAALNAATACC